MTMAATVDPWVPLHAVRRWRAALDPGHSNLDDDTYAELAKAACDFISRECYSDTNPRRFVTSDWVESFYDGNDDFELPVLHGPVQEVSAVYINGRQITPIAAPGLAFSRGSAMISWQEGSILSRVRFERGVKNVCVSYRSGWDLDANFPPELIEAAAWMAAYFYVTRGEKVGLDSKGDDAGTTKYVSDKFPLWVNRVIAHYTEKGAV